MSSLGSTRCPVRQATQCPARERQPVQFRNETSSFDGATECPSGGPRPNLKGFYIRINFLQPIQQFPYSFVNLKINALLNSPTCLASIACWIQQVTAPTLAVNCWLQQLRCILLSTSTGGRSPSRRTRASGRGKRTAATAYGCAAN